jgi:putative nucleotide binding protein
MRSDKKEIYAVVIEYLLHGRSDTGGRQQYKHEPIVQAVGKDQFKLLELVPKVDTISINDEVYIGDKERDKIERVKRRIGYSDLTQTAKVELPFAIEGIVKDDEERYVVFYNNAVPILIKFHMLHLLPGIGKKLMQEILTERQKRPFTSFSDISERIKTIPHPEQMIVKRVLEEIQDPDIKYRIFTSQ